jgi:dolichol-phosphate mannosyltransferase
MKLSVIIPAHNEAGALESTAAGIIETLDSNGVDYEVIVVDDASTDETAAIISRLSDTYACVRGVASPYRNGFGYAVRAGLDQYIGDAAAIVMADGSDHPADILSYYRLLSAGYECAFGSRFMSGGSRRGYPLPKLIVNRIVNTGIRLLFGHGYNDTTNAFKAYRREVIDNIQPLISPHFNLTVEMPLKAVVRGHSYAIVPISWTNRRTGESKLSLHEMGSRYLFIILYVFFEHHLSRGDYRRAPMLQRSGHHLWRSGSPGMIGRRTAATISPEQTSATPASETRVVEPLTRDR